MMHACAGIGDGNAGSVDAAVEILSTLAFDLHHAVHVPKCRCGLAIRKLQHAMAYLRPVHWDGIRGECARKDSLVDERTETCGHTTVTHAAVASHYGNITCLRCRKAAWKAGVR